MSNLIKVRALLEFSTIEQVFDKPAEAMVKYKAWFKEGYPVEWIVMDEKSWSEYQESMRKQIVEMTEVN